ncbi:ATP-binding protein [Streptomyces sp. NPDC056672]|uniref:ATP-binding protein n=1 Tax=Streptomyces sp. NPDC056672 TaxID=3345906 RepID=UPI0036C14B1D
MYEHPPHSPPAERPSPAGDLTTFRGLRSRLRRQGVVPALAGMAVPSSAWTLASVTDVPTAVALAVAGAGCGAVLTLARLQADLTAKVIQQDRNELLVQRAEAAAGVSHWLAHFTSQLNHVREIIARMCAEAGRGERPSPPTPLRPDGAEQTGEFAQLNTLLLRTLYEAMQGIAEAAARPQAVTGMVSVAGGVDAKAFVTIAERLLALVKRALDGITELERETEDPDLLGRLYRVDHIVTQMQRKIEGVHVLGGAVSFRGNEPVQLSTVLRAAGQEIEKYERVRTDWHRKKKIMVPGHVEPDVVHLLAELAENATNCSPGEVLIKAELVPSGLAIEVEDRGPHMLPHTREQMNTLLAAPDKVDVTEQVKDGRVGLLVAALLAERHGFTVELRRNLFGGTTAVVVLPDALVSVQDADAELYVPAPPEAVAARIPLTVAPAPALPQAQAPALVGGAAALPRRRGRPVLPAQDTDTAGAPEMSGAPGTADAAGADVRPSLPQRSGVPVPGAGHVEPRPAGPAVPASPTLMAEFTAGLDRAAAEYGPREHPGGPTDDSPSDSSL